MPESKRRKPKTKKPLTATVQVIVDDGPVEALEAAQADLEAARVELAASRERRVARYMLTVPAGDGDSPERRRLNAEVAADDEDEEILRPLRDAVTEAEGAVREATETFRFRALGRHSYDELVREHPPTDEDHELARSQSGSPDARAQYHTDTFAPALIAACLVDPPLSLDEVKSLWAEWNQAEAVEMFTTAYAVNHTRRTSSLGKGPGRTWSGVR